MPPLVPPACTFSSPDMFEASQLEWFLGDSREELDWQLQAVRVSQEDRSPNWSQGFKKGAREEMRLAAGMRERQRKI